MPSSTAYTPDPNRPWEHNAGADPLAAAKALLSQTDTTDPRGRTLAQTSGPQVGQRITKDGITGEWNGQTWVKVDSPDPSAVAGYHPSLEDSQSPWIARMKGFLSGASQAATPDKIGTIATLAAVPTGGLSLPMAIALGAGTTGALDLARSHFDTVNAPQSGGEALTDMVESGAAPAIAAGIGKGASLLGNVIGHRKVGTALGAATGGYEGYQRGGVGGALVGAATGGAAGAFGQTKLQKLAKLFGIGEDTAAADAASAAQEGFRPMRAKAPAPWEPLNTPVPAPSSTRWSDPQLIDPAAIKAASQVNRYGSVTGSATSSAVEPTGPASTMDMGLDNGRTGISRPEGGWDQAISMLTDPRTPGNGNISFDKPSGPLPPSLDELTHQYFDRKGAERALLADPTSGAARTQHVVNPDTVKLPEMSFGDRVLEQLDPTSADNQDLASWLDQQAPSLITSPAAHGGSELPPSLSALQKSTGGSSDFMPFSEFSDLVDQHANAWANSPDSARQPGRAWSKKMWKQYQDLVGPREPAKEIFLNK